MKKTFSSKRVAIGTGVLFALFAFGSFAKAEGTEFGPPAGIPMGPPTESQMGPPPGIPPMGEGVLPEGIPNLGGAPANTQQGPGEQQLKMMQRGEEMQRKGEEMQKLGEQKQLQGMKKGAKGMEQALKKFENTFAQLESKGIVLGASTKEKLTTVRTGIDTIKSAQTVAEIDAVDMDALQEKLTSLGDEIGGYQKMIGLKKMLASMNRGVDSFEKRVAKLQTQGVTVPTPVAEDFAKLKEGLQKINDAKSPEDMDAVDPDELGDLMTKVNESRPLLEMAAKWPRVLKQADQQLKSFNKQLGKTKVLVDTLTSQGFDVTEDFTTFQNDVAALQTARDASDALMKEGKSEEAFTKIEEDFFNKLDNAGEHQRVIQNLANLGRFNAEFKRGMIQAQKTITSLTKKKIDVIELQALYDQALAKGNEILGLLKVKPLDEEAVSSAMDAMENLRQQFSDKAETLGAKQKMPWEEKAPEQFKDFSLPKDFGDTLSQVKAL